MDKIVFDKKGKIITGNITYRMEVIDEVAIQFLAEIIKQNLAKRRNSDELRKKAA